MITLRPARLDDAERLFAWRNDPLTRKNFRNGEPVAWPDHLKWLDSTLRRDDRTLLIGENDGAPIGTVRFDRYPDYLEISWTGAPEARRKGFAKQMAVMACERIYGVPILAEIKPDNAATINMIRACGFVLTGEHDGLTTWRREARCSPPMS